jgi:archaellum component FlaC
MEIYQTLVRDGITLTEHFAAIQELHKRMDKLEGTLNFKLNDGPIANHSKRIKELEETVELLSKRLNEVVEMKR